MVSLNRSCLMVCLRLAAVLVCLASPGRAQDLMIVTEEFPPYNFTSQGQAAGISVEVVQAVLDETGLEAGFQFLPWARAYLTAQNRPNTLIFSIGRIPEREDLFEWVGPIAPYRTSLYRLAQRTDITVASLDEAKQHLIGVSVEDVIFTYLKGEGFTKLDIVGEDIFNIRKLALGRLDLVAYDEASFQHRLVTEEMDPALFDRVFRLEEISGHLYMAFQKDSDPELVARFRDGLEAVKTNGTYEQILTAYKLDF